ncbi:MAG: DUF47 domain-containing protein [Sciscionella sp.]
MRLRLTPQNARFYDLLTAAAVNLVEGAAILSEFRQAPACEREQLAGKMRAAEHAGDEATHAIIEELDRSFVTPFDREDIYRLAVNIDDVMDFMEAAVDLAVLYDVHEFPPGVTEQIQLLGQAAELTAKAMPRLRGLRDLVPYWIEINDLENQADRVYRKLLSLLFSGEFDTLTVMKVKDIVEQLEAAADSFEHVADVVHTLAVKES